MIFFLDASSSMDPVEILTLPPLFPSVVPSPVKANTYVAPTSIFGDLSKISVKDLINATKVDSREEMLGFVHKFDPINKVWIEFPFFDCHFPSLDDIVTHKDQVGTFKICYL